MKKSLFCTLFASAVLVGANAADVEIEGAFAKATPPNAKNSAVFFTIKNNGDKDVSLIDASNTLSEVTELHTHLHEDGMMKMVKVQEIKIPAKSSVELRPGGLHVMLIGLKKAGVKEGDSVDLTLKFDDGSETTLKGVKARKLPAMGHGADGKMTPPMGDMNGSKPAKM